MITVDNRKDLISEFEKGNGKVMVTGKLRKQVKIVTRTLLFFRIIVVLITFSLLGFTDLHIRMAGEILFALFILTSRPFRYIVALFVCVGPQRMMLDEKSYAIDTVIDSKDDHIVIL